MKKKKKIENNHHRMEFRETQLVNLLSKRPQRKLVIIKEAEQSQQIIQILKKKRKCNTETNLKNQNGDSDSDASVKKSIPTKIVNVVF